MIRQVIILAFASASAYGAQCTPPPPVLDRLSGYLSYEGTLGFITNGQNKFSFASAGDKELFLQYGTSRYVSGAMRRVYVVTYGKPVFATPCPPGSNWARCALDSFQGFYGQKGAGTRAIPVGRTCDLFITVPRWRPSPNDATKRKLASEVLQELEKFGYGHARTIYVRDFNINDPQLQFFIVDQNGQQVVQGCDFNAQVTPHCEWHLFGQAPVEQLKNEIMERAYRLFPNK